jgi:hypothetical protein
MIKKFTYVAIFTALTSVWSFAQTPSPTPLTQTMPQMAPSPASLETIISEAEKQSLNYREEFKNLLATETKTFERFDKNGEMKDKSVIETIFLVYQSPKDEKVTSELRNVTKVDDKLIPDSRERADRFLQELQKTTSVKKELEKLQDEGLRYDKTIRIDGFTLNQATALSDNVRPVFDFKLIGTENYQGHEVYVVSYQQTKKSPLITDNEKEAGEKGYFFDVSLPGSLKKADKFLRGKLWIDAQTFQLWREERQLIVQAATPIVAQEFVFEYQTSDFGILVPKQIAFIENAVKKVSSDNQFSVLKNTKITFDYSKFRKTDVDVKILDDN